ncbi:MAG TPA: hypothetical protein VJS30_13900, partial [Paraburkholderia sp.]|nr:hypothetical protein [Paraburkholderia sp.]
MMMLVVAAACLRMRLGLWLRVRLGTRLRLGLRMELRARLRLRLRVEFRTRLRLRLRMELGARLRLRLRMEFRAWLRLGLRLRMGFRTRLRLHRLRAARCLGRGGLRHVRRRALVRLLHRERWLPVLLTRRGAARLATLGHWRVRLHPRGLMRLARRAGHRAAVHV